MAVEFVLPQSAEELRINRESVDEMYLNNEIAMNDVDWSVFPKPSQSRMEILKSKETNSMMSLCNKNALKMLVLIMIPALFVAQLAPTNFNGACWIGLNVFALALLANALIFGVREPDGFTVGNLRVALVDSAPVVITALVGALGFLFTVGASQGPELMLIIFPTIATSLGISAYVRDRSPK